MLLTSSSTRMQPHCAIPKLRPKPQESNLTMQAVIELYAAHHRYPWSPGAIQVESIGTCK